MAKSLTIPVEDWWLDEARAKLRGDERSDRELAEIFRAFLGGSLEGVRSYVNKFKNGKVGATLALVRAIQQEYRINIGVWFPATPEEAAQILHTVAWVRARQSGQDLEGIRPPASTTKIPTPPPTKPKSPKMADITPLPRRTQRK